MGQKTGEKKVTNSWVVQKLSSRKNHGGKERRGKNRHQRGVGGVEVKGRKVMGEQPYRGGKVGRHLAKTFKKFGRKAGGGLNQKEEKQRGVK